MLVNVSQLSVVVDSSEFVARADFHDVNTHIITDLRLPKW